MKTNLHPKLSREWIDPFAVSIIKRLQDKGYVTYLVGGCVRDLLCGIRPKDFDIVTLAKPEEIKDTIDRAYIIGRRFRLVLVKRGNDQFEVATFRRAPTTEESLNEEGLQVSDNEYGTPEEDALRRDFTVNGLFYDPIKDELIDHCEGMQDINERIIRVIGDPDTRLTEDPIRILRALRLAHKVGFTIEHDLRQAMVTKASALTQTVLPRRREELLKILKLQDPSLTLHEAHDLGILKHAYPSLDRIYNSRDHIDEFEMYLERIRANSIPYGISEPIYLFGVLILAYVRAKYHPDPHMPFVLTEDQAKELGEFMKKEFGIFNNEESLIMRSIELQSELLKVHDFERRGSRRKNGFLRNDALPLALVFAELDHVLSPNDLHFWQREMKPVAHEVTNFRKQKRRRKRPGPKA